MHRTKAVGFLVGPTERIESGGGVAETARRLHPPTGGRLKDRDDGIRCLEQACRTRDAGITTILVELAFDALRPHPRFGALVKQVLGTSEVGRTWMVPYPRASGGRRLRARSSKPLPGRGRKSCVVSLL
jgi:hypothetical protein